MPDLAAAIAEHQRSADYYIDRLKAVSAQNPVRDLDEAEGAYLSAKNALNNCLRPAGDADPVYPVTGTVWFRKSTSEWILEITSVINDTWFTSRHPQPASLAAEDVPGLPALYAQIPEES